MSGNYLEKIHRITVDVESDWGGRTEGTRGVREGLPRILTLLNTYNLKALFFISTELLEDFGNNSSPLNNHIEKLVKYHKVASHGHFHIEYKNKTRLLEDRRLSEQVLSLYGVENPVYRPPRFNPLGNISEPYSNPKNHISLLKATWFNASPNKHAIFYLHPFDIVGGMEAPSLFCKLWYSRPKKALQMLDKVLDTFAGESYL